MTLKKVVVCIDRRFPTSRRMNLRARIVQWRFPLDGVVDDGGEETATYGVDILKPSIVCDVEMAKRLVREYLRTYVSDIEFILR